jgi:hypothetical protein
MNFLLLKTKRQKMLVCIILFILLIIGYITIFFRASSNYIMFVYIRSNETNNTHVADIKSGYANLLSCQKAGRIYDVSMNGKSVSYFHCATGCPIDADTEKDCNQHD